MIDLSVFSRLRMKGPTRALRSLISPAMGWSGSTLHFVWFDEEPPYDHYSEGLTRTNAGDNGSVPAGLISDVLGVMDVLAQPSRCGHRTQRMSRSSVISMDGTPKQTD